MIRSSTHEMHYSRATLSNGSPVLVVHVHKAGGSENNPHAGELPPPPEPMVVVYPRPTALQSWRLIQKGCAMLWQCLRSAGGRYLRRCNMAHEHLAGIHINRKTDK